MISRCWIVITIKVSLILSIFRIEMDVDDLDDELELPRELGSLTAKEKRTLLRFKRSHNEVIFSVSLSLFMWFSDFFVLIICIYICFH